MRGVCIATVGTVMIQNQEHFTVSIFKILNKAIQEAKGTHHIRLIAQSDSKSRNGSKIGEGRNAFTR